jgi:hypothetical protein
MRERKKPTIIGFSKYKDKIQYYHCQIHQGARLVPMSGEEGLYLCRECGVPYNPSDVLSDTKITSKFNVTPMQKQIVAGKNRGHRDKEFYDQTGNKINKQDPDVMQDIAAGRTIVYYHTDEDLGPKKEFTHVKKR